jgi:hypothetical protein
VDPTLEALWKRVVENWDDDGQHGKLVSYAQQNKLLGEAAALYKEAATVEGSPYRLSVAQGEDAKKRLAGIAMLAVMDLDASKTDPTVSRGMKIIRVVAASILVLCVGLLFWALTRR